MKKILFFILPILIAPSISACQDKAHSIVPIHVMSGETKGIEINGSEFAYLVESGQPFAMEFYSPYCSHCEDLRPNLEKYMDETKNLIYRFDLTKLTKEETDNFTSKYPDILPDTYVPALRFVKNGKLTYSVDGNKFNSYKSLRQILNQHFLSSHVNIVSSKETFEEYLKLKDSYLIYNYNLDNLKSVEIASKHLITTEFTNKNMPVLLVNSKEFVDNSFDSVKQFYSTDIDSFVALVSDQKVTKIAD